MNVSGLVSSFRSRVFDVVAPYLWSDEEIISYANEAQFQYCRDVRGIADTVTPEITIVRIVPGSADVKLDSRVLQVRSVYATNQQRELTPLTEVDYRRRGQSARPYAYTLDETDGYISFDCTPAEGDVLRLSVFRLPLEELTGPSDELEVPVQHHMSLMAWMEHLAYLKPDSETYDKRKSDDASSRFQDFAKAARHELSRQRHVARSVRYGGIM